MPLQQLDKVWTHGTHIYFRNVGAVRGQKTNRYEVVTDKDFLGFVKWYAPWRKYAFFPYTGTLYEETCLREIAEFCETTTKQYRNER